MNVEVRRSPRDSGTAEAGGPGMTGPVEARSAGPGPRVLPCGADALLVEVDSLAAVLGLDTALADLNHPGILETVPAARTVLVRVDPALLPLDRARTLLCGVDVAPQSPVPGRSVVIEVSYDGPDLEDLAAALGMGSGELIARHTRSEWRCAFIGFVPGFAYLVDGDPALRCPRRPEPRVRVPAGAVALAGEYAAVYPRASPGGWQLIGRTDARMWDPDRADPALILPGDRVVFRPREAR